MNSSQSSTILSDKTQRVAGRVPRWLIRGLLALLAIAIILPLSGGVYQTVATRIDRGNYPAPGQLFDVGGYRLHLYCIGENVAGRPTVILEQGLGGTSAAWARVQPEIAQTTRVCAYDRAGMGWSEPSLEPRDAGHIVADLHSLLQKADVPGPYVLVGWSFGGLYVRRYAGQYPEEVRGMVLLDASHPDQWSSTPAGQAQYRTFARLNAIAPTLARVGLMRIQGLLQPDSGLPEPQSGALRAFYAATKDWDAQSAEFLASPTTNDQVSVLTSLADMPLFVLTATEHGTPHDMEQQWQAWQSELAQLSTDSIHQVVTRADHASSWLDPEIAKTSVAAVVEVVEAAHAGVPLQP